MWRWTAMVVALVLVHAWAPTLRAADSCSSLVSQHNWTRFEVVLGRLTAIHLRGGQSHTAKDADSAHFSRESISVNGDASAPAFRYERFSPDQTLTVEIVDRVEVEILRESKTASGQASFHFVQPAQGPLRLTRSEGDDVRIYSASSVWHLLLAAPEISRTHLVPILTMLRPDWQLMERAANIEAALLATAELRPVISQTDLIRAVSQLDSRQFAQRQAADRMIRSLGISVLPYLSELERSTLSTEQRLRLRKIRLSMSVPTPDTAERVAVWLSNDKAIWLAFLSHAEPSIRERAAQRLTGIHRGVVQFDPFANATQRQEQITLLRSRLGMAY